LLVDEFALDGAADGAAEGLALGVVAGGRGVGGIYGDVDVGDVAATGDAEPAVAPALEGDDGLRACLAEHASLHRSALGEGEQHRLIDYPAVSEGDDAVGGVGVAHGVGGKGDGGASEPCAVVGDVA